MKELLKRIASTIVSISLKIIVYFWLIKLAKKYRTSVPKVNFIKEKEENTLAYYGKGSIRIDIYKHHSFGALKRTVFHEYRHHWQWSKQHLIFQWWIEHNEIYANLYPYTSIELDAYRFGNSLGVLDDDLVFRLMPLEAIENCYSDGSLEEVFHKLSYLLNQNK